MDQNERRNLWIAMILSTLIFLGWGYLFDKPIKETPSLPSKIATPVIESAQSNNFESSVITESHARLDIDTLEFKGSIDLRGAKLDDLKLKNYRVSVDSKSPIIDLLVSGQNPYYVDFTWTSSEAGLQMPDEHTLWTADRKVLTSEQPVTLNYKNSQGLTFEKIISVDSKFMFTISQKITNQSGAIVSVQERGRLVRHNTPITEGYFILHEGPIGYLNEKLIELSYKDLKKSPTVKNTTGGWLGITDKYWLTALIPDQKMVLKTEFYEAEKANQEVYQISFMTEAVPLKPGESLSSTHHLFSGAKILDLLDQYEEKLGIKHFDLAVDFGWFYLITKPIFYTLNWLKQFLGNFGLAIMMLTVIFKLAFFPLANKSYRSMARMKQLQPELEKIRARYNDDKLRMNQEVMALYKKQQVNPMAGCLPMFIQFPVFFALYKVMFVSIEMRQAPFYGWIQDLSIPDPTTIFNLFGLIPWIPPSFLMLGVWPILMGLTMVIQQKLNPPPADPIQAKLFMFMPIIFTYMLGSFPVGLVIYWTWNNILTIAQQWTMMRLDHQKIASSLNTSKSSHQKKLK